MFERKLPVFVAVFHTSSPKVYFKVEERVIDGFWAVLKSFFQRSYVLEVQATASNNPPMAKLYHFLNHVYRPAAAEAQCAAWYQALKYIDNYDVKFTDMSLTEFNSFLASHANRFDQQVFFAYGLCYMVKVTKDNVDIYESQNSTAWTTSEFKIMGTALNAS